MIENIAKISKFNFWNEEVPELGYLRGAYLEKIRLFSGNRLVKVIVGQRRVGKSYLLRQIIHNLIQSGVPPQNTFYINKEFLDFDFLTDYKSLELLIESYKTKLKPQGKVYLFIDEIQTISGWERLVDSYSQNF